MLVVMSIPDEQLPTTDEVRRLFLAHLRYVSGAEYLDAFNILPDSDDLPLETVSSLPPDNDVQVIFYSFLVDDNIPGIQITRPGPDDSSLVYDAYKFE